MNKTATVGTNSSWLNKTFFQHLLFNCSLAPTNIYQNYSISPDRKLLPSTHCYGSLQSKPELLTTVNTATTILLYLAKKYPCGKRKAVILTVTSHYTRYYFTVYTRTTHKLLIDYSFRTACPSNRSGNKIPVTVHGIPARNGCSALWKHGWRLPFNVRFISLSPTHTQHRRHKLIALVIKTISLLSLSPWRTGLWWISPMSKNVHDMWQRGSHVILNNLDRLQVWYLICRIPRFCNVSIWHLSCVFLLTGRSPLKGSGH